MAPAIDAPTEESSSGGYSEPKAWQRFYMGYRERFVDDCVLRLKSGLRTVRLAQAPSAKTVVRRSGLQLDKYSDPALTGTTVWDGAVALSHFLVETDVLDALRAGKNGREFVSIELGAGTGAVSLSLLACGCVSHAVFTDIPDMLPHLHHNISKNSSLIIPSRAIVRPLRWGITDDIQQLEPYNAPFDLIVGADLVYYTFSESTPHSDLLHQTLKRLSGPQTMAFLALSLHHNPDEVEAFLQRIAPDFAVERMNSVVPEEYRVPDVLIVRLTLRPVTSTA